MEMNIESLQKKLQIVEKRCNFWKKENERLVLKQKLLLEHFIKLQDDRRILVERLKSHKDNFQQSAKNYYSYLQEDSARDEETSEAAQPTSPQSADSQKKKKKIVVEGKKKEKVIVVEGKKKEKVTVVEGKKKEKVTVVEGKKKEKMKDKDMPKKPNNPYFQFCLEQRSIVEEEHATGHLVPTEDQKSKGLSKPHLIKILASRWKQLSEDEKKVYIERYKVDKERYAMEKSHYSASRAVAIPPLLPKDGS